MKRNDKNINLPQQVDDMFAPGSHSVSNDVLVIDLEIILNRNLEAELCCFFSPGAVQKVSKKLEMHVYSKRLEIMLQ